jgi:hypothetical protein
VSIFAQYFAIQLLGHMGWPRKLGRFKGEGYETAIADLAIAQSIDWGASIGAGHPRIALQMIAEMFRDRDWDGDDPPNVKVFVEGVRQQPTWTAGSPREAVRPLQLETSWPKSTITVEEFQDRRLGAPMEQLLLHALLWGLSEPDRFEAWYAAHGAEHEAGLPLAQRAGLDMEALPSLAQSYENSAEIVRDYERDIAPLPLSIPARLLADAEALAWRI